MPNSRFASRLTNNILDKSLESTGAICLALFELGEIYVDSFLPQHYKFTHPTRKLLGLETIKWPRKKTFQESLRRLERYGIVEKRKKVVSLSKIGKQLIKKIINRKKSLKKVWDGRYRLVIFDIPENKKLTRNWLREELYLLKYVQLQKSVFIGKHSLPVEIIRDIKRFGIEKNVNYLLVEKLYDTSRLRNDI